jgi:adenine-specific DNA methylase
MPLDALTILPNRFKRMAAAKRSLVSQTPSSCCISTNSSTELAISDNSQDYIFVDPPFGANLAYAELSFLWEAWLQVFTSTEKEAIENRHQEKSINEYRTLMSECFAEAYRILKPGRWMTVEFSNTKASVWNAIQMALQDAGFVVANVSALDKKQGSFKAVTTPTAVRQDLVISAYKPSTELEERITRDGGTEQSAWDFVRAHLQQLPRFKGAAGRVEFITERDPRILYDRLVAWFVRHEVAVPLSSLEFQVGLAQRFVERDGM